jgi:predicted  nucleic acid-binding Zn-ribbon protein
LEELEDRLRSATTTLRATHEELEHERKRCAELDAALARARDSTTAAFGEKIQTTRELAEAVAALEGEKADAMHERARLLERMDALERDGVVDGAVMNENLRIELANERAKRGALEEALTDLKLASDASMELSVALRQEVEALRSSGAQPSVSLTNIEPTDEIPPRAASAIEAHLIWRRRDARNEPGDASSDWVKAESIVTDRLARADGARVVYWAYLNALAELLRVGDVAAFDQTSWRALGDFVARVLAASRASSS